MSMSICIGDLKNRFEKNVGLWRRFSKASFRLVPLDLPPLIYSTSLDVEKKWEEAKQLSSVTAQLRFVEKHNLRNRIAADVRPVNTLGSEFLSLFGRRDTYRNRLYGSPELLALLGKTPSLLKERLPGATILIGDISQAGAGPLEYGTTVDLRCNTGLRDGFSAFLAKAKPEGNTLTVHRVLDGSKPIPGNPGDGRPPRRLSGLRSG